MVTLSRKRRCTRALTVARNHVAVADTPIATAANRTRRQSPWSTPSPSSLNQSASSASGSAQSSERVKAATSRPGSCLYPSLHSRHIEESAGGRPPGLPARGLDEDVIALPFFVLGTKALRLQIEHRAVAASLGHQLVVRAEFDHLAALEHADPIGLADGREAM